MPRAEIGEWYTCEAFIGGMRGKGGEVDLGKEGLGMPG